MADLQKTLASIAQKNIDVAGIGTDVVDLVLEPSLRELAERTDTPIDDAIVDFLVPQLLPMIRRKISQLAAAIDPV